MRPGVAAGSFVKHVNNAVVDEIHDDIDSISECHCVRNSASRESAPTTRHVETKFQILNTHSSFMQGANGDAWAL